MNDVLARQQLSVFGLVFACRRHSICGRPLLHRGALFATYRFAWLVPGPQKEAQEVVAPYHANDLRE
jgi:hypothetical protein